MELEIAIILRNKFLKNGDKFNTNKPTLIVTIIIKIIPDNLSTSKTIVMILEVKLVRLKNTVKSFPGIDKIAW